MSNGATITAKFPGKCICGARVQRGDKIVYDRSVVGCAACGAVDGPFRASNGLAVESAWVFVDGSGACSLIRCDGTLFSCSFSAGIKVTIVQNKARNISARKSDFAKVEAAFREVVVDHFTPAYLAKNAEMYADIYAADATTAPPALRSSAERGACSGPVRTPSAPGM
jgi:hypothetical protein